MSTTAQKKLVPTRTGVVTSDKRAKTRTAVFEFQTMHPKYGKYVKNRTRLQFHDEKNESHTGDLVEISECRPVSKSKQWKLVRILDKRSVTRVQNVVSGAAEIEPAPVAAAPAAKAPAKAPAAAKAPAKKA
ncbi:MAG: 30S ribosomal protein S17 [Planctomycetes bacterium]|nr:30S ribosomal protein S17 [Planctomycetota bacterium]